jgi:ribosomal protein S18 acetylase RimI-like enzyme
MKIDDLAPVFHLGEKLFTSERHANLYRTWSESEVTSMFLSAPRLCLVAEEEDELAGFLLGTTIQKARTAWNYGHLVWFGVAPRWQRSGLGQRLYDRFREIMIGDGIRILIVDTQADNEKALSFFERQGFSQATDHVYLSLNLESSDRRKDDIDLKGNDIAL